MMPALKIAIKLNILMIGTKISINVSQSRMIWKLPLRGKQSKELQDIL